ncbi:hypothetical protein TNCV_735741 [Trichonephila clavipes]|uniref:Uncharacterized protein n=1 Tax=Trichonephila clavipes TaxID=2585209 RepID=A0A8X6SML9_TRICX|nr:hypothetical protein TNCV_735741 [Trichonephila clavipes]
MAYDAEDWGFQILNNDEIVTSVQEESDFVDDETDEDEDNNNESSKVHQMLTRFLHWRQLWSGTNNNQSAVLLNYCCSRESKTLQRKNEGVQCTPLPRHPFTRWSGVEVRCMTDCHGWLGCSPIFGRDDFFQHLWPYIGNNTANVVFQMVKRLWLIRIDQ